MRKLVIGILAHVDAGKTTLSEGMLYTCGTLKRLGRVDHQDAFLDTEALERERGITIFSKQAVLPLPSVEVTLLDTPGHVDFSSEMERTLQVLDCAILVISGTDGVQGHTRTLWRLLERYHIPTFLFVNKMDLAGADRAALLAELQEAGQRLRGLRPGADPGSRRAWPCATRERWSDYLERGQVEPEEIRGPGGGAQAVSLLVRLRPEAGGGGGVPGGAGAVCPPDSAVPRSSGPGCTRSPGTPKGSG